MNITLLKPYEKNAKAHPSKQVKQIAASIKEFGFNQPIVVDKDNVVIVGHGRLEAAKLLGLTDVPVVTIDLTEEQAKAYRLADNRLNESDWDMKLVIEELKELSAPMLELTGFSSDLILTASDKDDAVPNDAPTRANPGDIWQLGVHRVMCGDATKMDDVERLMDGVKADLIFTDPPYNVDYEGGSGLKIKNDKMGDSAFALFLHDSFVNMATFTKKGGAAYVCHADTEGLNFRMGFQQAGFLLKSCLIWNKDSLVMGRADYHWKHEPILLGEMGEKDEESGEMTHEPILYGWQDGDKHEWYGGRKQTTVWDIPKPKKNAEHPTMKPIELVCRAILNSSKKEDTVMDLFAGSGSTLIACEKSERVARVMELDPKYVDVIIQRWEDYTGKKASKV